MDAPVTPPGSVLPAERASAWLALWSGAVFGVALVKLGSPVILAEKVHTPENLLEVVLLSWPHRWGYALLGLWLLVGVLLAWRLPLHRAAALASPWWRWTPWLLMAWLAWQALAACFSIEPRLTRLVLPHFLACVACFVAGRFLLARTRHADYFWGLLALAVMVTLVHGADQHWGGLEATRRQFEQLPPEMRVAMDTPEFRARMASNRIFSTFFYPNAFAGGLLLALPPALALVWRWLARRSRRLALAIAGAIGLAGLACLGWTGSKAGWLIALLLGVAVLWLGPMAPRYKWALATALCLAGLLGFWWKHASYVARGAPSARARLTYWRVAWDNVREHPAFGTGPGTFTAVYRAKKPPEAESTRMVHNDYLQQATDSGLPGMLLYTLFVAGMLAGARPARWQSNWPAAAWLGVLGWALQGLVEFGLYIPALAWPAFLWLGWLRAERLAGPSFP
ncbi:O-antigen ligase family protein [Fontisphaera persica]|uniref:O-antigen ligase family protein n=1 Tax=Fontisphaera persica TaxID=2974023 RepID=UPI0024C0926B|nr:O-antigen ligase family protein [Fontisphaera persica]WCJ59177.1 O-antigen ligase family protein [Fontisphaera persica]